MAATRELIAEPSIKGKLPATDNRLEDDGTAA
jgi:hypothetical protein